MYDYNITCVREEFGCAGYIRRRDVCHPAVPSRLKRLTFLKKGFFFSFNGGVAVLLFPDLELPILSLSSPTALSPLSRSRPIDKEENTQHECWWNEVKYHQTINQSINQSIVTGSGRSGASRRIPRKGTEIRNWATFVVADWGRGGLKTQVLEFHRAGNEADVRVFLHEIKHRKVSHQHQV